jgi:hypothetical protein
MVRRWNGDGVGGEEERPLFVSEGFMTRPNLLTRLEVGVRVVAKSSSDGPCTTVSMDESDYIIRIARSNRVGPEN